MPDHLADFRRELRQLHELFGWIDSYYALIKRFYIQGVTAAGFKG